MSILSGVWLAAWLGAGTPAAPALELRSSDSATLRGCKAAVLDKQLRDRLRKSSEFRLSEAGQHAPLALEILECSLFEVRQRALTTGGRPVRLPTEDRGTALGSENELALRQDATPRAVLKARLGAGSRFLALASGPKDKNLSEAADSLKRSIERALRERGRWLLEGAAQ
jgi:hypothetical protein